jgi:dimethylaniline monooxygenase (N-oxide forming)
LRIGIIGSGISGIAAAHSLRKTGHDVQVYEKSDRIGGVWALGYPGVRLQNTRDQYRLMDVPWSTKPDLHPTSAQVQQHLQEAVDKLDLPIKLGHEVTKLEETDRGWRLHYRNSDNTGQGDFDFVVLSIGQYSSGKRSPEFPGQDKFQGKIVTEREITDLSVFSGKKVLVAGFGKSALDMATFAVDHASEVHHLFRTPRWMVPFRILGLHYSRLLFCRMGTFLMPSWVQPNATEAFIHRNLGFLVRGNWRLVQSIIRLQKYLLGVGKSRAVKDRLSSLTPKHDIVSDFRSASAMQPQLYLKHIATERLLPQQGELHSFTERGVVLEDGDNIDCDVVVLSLGSGSPTFPFLPAKYRSLLESEPDGAQLYRHLLHPDIPRLAFAGFNHGFMHVPAVEIGMLWLSAVLNDDLTLPNAAEMRQSMESVRQWKRDHVNFEPSRSCAVNTRFQQYLDVLLKDLGLNPYRKMPNILAELFSQYGPDDYLDIFEEYRARRTQRSEPLHTLALDT